jgi:hypothetical protein
MLGIFEGNAQKRVPKEAVEILRNIPSEFVDDGCSASPDSLFGFDFRWACRVHDWRYCSRCHPPQVMTQHGRTKADEELRRFISVSLPKRWRWVKWVYYSAVVAFGGVKAWDCCGPEVGERCKHNMPLPSIRKAIIELQSSKSKEVGKAES